MQKEKSGELQHSKGWKWEAGIGGGRSEKDLEVVYSGRGCVALMGFGEVTISEESQLEELRLS